MGFGKKDGPKEKKPATEDPDKDIGGDIDVLWP